MGANGSTNKSSTPTQNMTAIKEFIDKEISSHEVVIFSKSYCPYCRQTKSLFNSQPLSGDVKVHELDQMPNGNAIQNQLLQLTGQRTVPNVFVKGSHTGGNDDIQAAFQSGRLQEVLS